MPNHGISVGALIRVGTTLSFIENGSYICEVYVLCSLIAQDSKLLGCDSVAFGGVKPTFIRTAILCLWFSASLIYINNCLTRRNTKQSIYYSTSSLYMFRVSNTPIIRNTQNCNYSLRYCAATSLQPGQVGHVGGR